MISFVFGVSFIVLIIKYFLIYILFSPVQLKRKWMIPMGVVLVGGIKAVTRLNYGDLNMIMLIFAIIILLLCIQETVIDKLLHIIIIIFIVTCTEELIEIVITYFYFLVMQVFLSLDMKSFISNYVVFFIAIVITVVIRKSSIIRNDKLILFVRKTLNLCILIMEVSIVLTIAGLNYSQRYIENSRYITLTTILCITSYISIIILGIFMMYIKKSNEKAEKYFHIEQNLNVILKN